MIRGLLTKPPWFDEMAAGLSWPTVVVWESLTKRLGRELPDALNNSLLTSEAAICENCGKQVIAGIARAGNVEIVIEVLSMLMEQQGSLLVNPIILLNAALQECDFETQGSIVWILSKKHPEVANWIELEECYFPNLTGYLIQRGEKRTVRFDEHNPTSDDSANLKGTTLLDKLHSKSFESLFQDLLMLYLGNEDILVEFLTSVTEQEALLLVKYFRHIEGNCSDQTRKTEIGSVRIPSEDWIDDYMPRKVGIISSSDNSYVVTIKGGVVRNDVNPAELKDVPLNIGSRVVVTADKSSIRNTLGLYDKYKSNSTLSDSVLSCIGIANSFLPVEKNKNTHGSWVEVLFESNTIPLIQSTVEPLPLRVQDFIEFFLAVRFEYVFHFIFCFLFCILLVK